MPLHIEVVTNSDSLEQLSASWRDLWQDSAGATIFQSPDWLLPWWRYLGQGQLRVIAVRKDTRLVGLIPLFRLPTPAGRQLLLLGCGNSDQLGVLAADGFGPAVIDALFSHLADSRQQWDCCHFHPLADDSLLLSAPAPWEDRVDRVPQDVCPRLQLPGNSADLSRVIPDRQWKRLKYYRRRAEREGRLEIGEATQADAAEKLEALFRLHQQRWGQVGEPGVLALDQVRQFHAEVVQRLARSGHLRLYILCIDYRPVAALYGMLHAGCFSYYIGGFDPALKALSPGMLIVGHAIQRAIEEGAEAFDFLRGREAYKYAWGACDRVYFARRLGNTGPGRPNRPRTADHRLPATRP